MKLSLNKAPKFNIIPILLNITKRYNSGFIYRYNISFIWFNFVLFIQIKQQNETFL